MKYSFMLLTPCLLLIHITANASAYERNDSTTQQHIYQNEYHAGRSVSEPVFSVEPRYLKLLQIIDQQQKIQTIKANYNGRSLFIPSVFKS